MQKEIEEKQPQRENVSEVTRSNEPADRRSRRVHLRPLDPGVRLNAVPAADVVAEMEAEDPRAVADAGLSSATMRAGDLVRGIRREAGLSQAQLAERIGVSQARIAELEAGRGQQRDILKPREKVRDDQGNLNL